MDAAVTTVLVAVLASAPLAAPAPAVAEVDRVRIAEAFRLADQMGDRLWPGWRKAPFAVLLVTPDHEFLFRHPKPSADFTATGEDALLGKVWHRPRTFPPTLEATFPAVGGVSTVVIGRAENTGSKTSTRWVLTLLHEHFHQLQTGQPRYYADVDALGLARGDTTGMWMLNFPFPYTAPAVGERFAAMSHALVAGLRARGRPGFPDALARYLASREEFRAALTADEFKYFAFQLWQEGIARYTECRLAELAAAEYTPAEAFRKLPDYRPFQDVAGDLLGGLEGSLNTTTLDTAKRTAVYAVGAAEGLLLDHARPGWRVRYFEDRFTLDGHFRMRP